VFDRLDEDSIFQIYGQRCSENAIMYAARISAPHRETFGPYFSEGIRRRRFLRSNALMHILKLMQRKLSAILALVVLMGALPDATIACEAYCSPARMLHGSEHVTQHSPSNGHHHSPKMAENCVQCASHDVNASMSEPACESLPVLMVLSERFRFISPASETVQLLSPALSFNFPLLLAVSNNSDPQYYSLPKQDSSPSPTPLRV
jgi:hypothetical protein